MKRILAALMVVVLVFTLCACAVTPTDTLKKFETAFNKRDMDAMIECFPPEFQSQFEMQMSLTQGLADMFGFGGLFSEEIFAAAFGMALQSYYIEIDVLEENYNEKGNICTCVVSITDEKGESTTEQIELIKLGGDWYLNIEMPDNGFDMGLGGW